MKALITIILITHGLASVAAHGQDVTIRELKSLEAGYELKVAELISVPHKAAVQDLRAKYAAALARSLEAAQNDGKLPEALAFKGEKELIEKGDEVPASDDEGVPEALKKFRTTYRDAKGKLDTDRVAKLRVLSTAQVKALTDLSVKLTKAGILEEAQLVQTKADALSKDAELAAPSTPRTADTTPASGAEKPMAPPASEANRAKESFAKKIDGTDWRWNGGSNILTFGKDGKVKMHDWERKGLVTGWTVLKPGTVELRILEGRTVMLTATLVFDDRTRSFSGTDFDGKPLATSPRGK